MKESKNVEDFLNEVDYSHDGYQPSLPALEFVNFIKLVNGGEGEENKTPVVHYKLLDNVFSKKSRLAILCFRGFAKSTILSEYLLLYCAVFGKMENFGEVTYALFIGDSMENGCRNMRKNMENRYNTSTFLQQYLPKSRFTDSMIEFTNTDGKQFAIRLAGAQQSIRGTRYLNKRPELCICDDLLTDADSKSPTCIGNVENTLHKGVAKALHPTKNKIIYVGTVFSANDPLYKVIESGRWSPSVYPVCETFPCSKENFKGAWPDRFPYEAVKEMYDDAIALGRLSDFNGEMMNRIMSEEDRLITDSDISWFKRSAVLDNLPNFNIYITTDFATSEKTSSDFSVISVWAYSNNGSWFWIDGVCARQAMDKNVDDVFRLAQMYKPISVGIEVTGQQGGFIPWLKEQMIVRNCFFTLASDNNGNKEGIRPSTNKLQRFHVVVPLFKQNKILFPEERKTSPEIQEAVNELSLVSNSGFRSKHDDFCDTISMLPLMSAWKPDGSVPIAKQDKSGVWVLDDDDDDYDSGYSSYIV